jgi:hypothetical protein
MSPLRALVLASVLLTTGWAGCLGTDGSIETNEAATDAPGLTQVVGHEGQPVAFAQVTAYGPTGDELAVTSANATGVVAEDAIAPAAERVRIQADGHEPWEAAVDELPATLELANASSAAELAPSTDSDALSLLRPLTLGAAYMADRPETCNVNNCGASEPVIELAGDGTIYVSGTCCVGGSPPIWYSKDGGHSFQLLRGDVARDSFGIEGDFAIDEAGNVYFSDISVASGYLSSWNAEEEHRWTIPAGPFVPPVDRPWIRAGPEDTAWFLYNQVASTLLYQSTDGGITWTLQQEFPGPLGFFERGPGLEELWVSADGHLWHSEDGGQTFEQLEEIPRPSDEGERFMAYEVLAIDEASNVWAVYDWTNGTSEAYHVYAVKRSPEGQWSDPIRVSPEQGTHHLPWAASSAEGSLALAWYGTLDDEAGPNEVDEDAQWELFTAATIDGTEDDPSFQLAQPDPAFVHQGPMDRKLLDFLQVEIGPEGAVHVAYAQDREGQEDERTEYVRSTTGLDLARDDYLNGP